MVETNDGERVRKLAGLYQMIERRYHQTLGQIPTSAEDHQGGGWRLTDLNNFCRGHCGFGSDHGAVLVPQRSTRLAVRGWPRFCLLLHIASPGRPSMQCTSRHSGQYSQHRSLGTVSCEITT